tara:strand:- start:539 stop:703 length:165 start_codon:yes stop_codon:yes gene_type:complete
MEKEKLYDPDNPFGIGKPKPIAKKRYYYKDKRTKKYGAQRPHKGIMGKYKTKQS